MDNFFYGLQALSVSLLETIRRAFAYQLFWGFVCGFGVSTIVHAYLFSDNPKAFASMVFQDKAKSFQKTYAKSETNKYTVSFSDYVKKVTKIKSSILISLILILIGIIFILISH